MFKNIKYLKFQAFVLTFLCYVGLHSIRTSWSYSKSQIQTKLNYSLKFLGVVDTVYVLSYAFGMLTISNLSKKFKLNWYIGFGMVGASLSFCSFAIQYAFTGNASKSLIIVGMALNGFCQSAGYPGMMAVMGNWFGKNSRGILLAIWSINANLGNIIGLLMCEAIQKNGLAWSWNIFCASGLTLIIAIMIILILIPKPEANNTQEIQKSLIESTVEVPDNNIISTDQTPETIKKVQEQQPIKQINVITALCIPRVPFYVISYAMLKGCTYGFLFWLPTYLTKQGLADQRANISSMIDIGAFVGGIIVGQLGDKYSYRALFLSPILFLSAAFMFIVYFTLGSNALPYYFLMILIGATMGGPYNVIGSAIAIDLGQDPTLKNKNAVTIVSALLESTAILFSAISQTIIPLIRFDLMFLLFGGQCFIACFTLLPLFIKDLKAFLDQRKKVTKNN